MTRIAIVAAAASLAGWIGMAGAQTSTPTSSNQGKCWDSATNQVRDISLNRFGSNAGGSAGSTSGSGMAGGNSSTGGTPGSGTSAGTNGTAGAQDRPAAAMGMPNC